MVEASRRELSDFELFTELLLILLRPLLSAALAVIEFQSGWRKTMIVKLEDKVTKERYYFAVQFSERKWPLPPSLIETYLDRLWNLVQRVIPYSELSETDLALVLAANLTWPSMRLSYRVRKTSGRSRLIYLAQRRGRTVLEVVLRIAKILIRYFQARIQGIRAARERCEERGLDTSRLRITQLETFFTIVISKLREGVRLLTGKDPDTVLRQV